MFEGDEYEDQLLGDPNQLDDIIEVRDLNPLEEEENQEDVQDQEQDDDNTKTSKPKKFRRLNPQPKLDALRLTGPRGLATIENFFHDFKFYGPGYESKDLQRIMERLELWGNRLFPKFTFDDLLEKVERLGHKRPVMNFVHKIRMGIITEDSVAEKPREESDNIEMGIDTDLDSETPRETLSNDDQFNQLIQQQISQIDSQQSHNSSSHAIIQRTITDEQRERMLHNRRLAEERRLAKIKAQQDQNSKNTQSDLVAGIEVLQSSFNAKSMESEVELSQVLDNIHTGHSIIDKNNPEDLEARKANQLTDDHQISSNMDETIPLNISELSQGKLELVPGVNEEINCLGLPL